MVILDMIKEVRFYCLLTAKVVIKSELKKHSLIPCFISHSLFFSQLLHGPAVLVSCFVFVTSVHGHSGKVSVKEWFILQQYCYWPHEGDTSRVSAFLAEKNTPTHWSSTSDQRPNPIRAEYFYRGTIIAKVNLPTVVCCTAAPLCSGKKEEILLWYPFVVYLPMDICNCRRKYPWSF